MAKKLEIQKQSFPSVADAYNGLLGIDTPRVVNLPISQLDEIDDQPFPVNDSKIDQIADSIENVGVIEPVIVVRNGERYNILSGRHRFRACQKLGKTEIPCYIKETDETIARYILIATNTDRNNEYSPIVYARAYAEQIELMKKLGKKAVVNAIAEQNGINRKQIYRYLRLNYLIPELQKWVEDSVLTIEAAVELSFLSYDKQIAITEHIYTLGIGNSVIQRHFKVNVTKNIRKMGESLSDEDFVRNIDSILFNNYSVVSDILPEAEPELQSEQVHDHEKERTESDDSDEDAAIPDEPKVEIKKGQSKAESADKKGLEAPKTKSEKTAEPAGTIPTERAAKSGSNGFEEIVKGYMLLALIEHGLDLESISLAQLDAVFDRYTKSEAAETYRREC